MDVRCYYRSICAIGKVVVVDSTWYEFVVVMELKSEGVEVVWIENWVDERQV